MLCLTRKKSEQIIIAGNIIITILELRGEKCRIGIEAPKEISVHRSEVQRAIDSEHRPAA